MRTLLGYTETGAKRWSENVPASPAMHASRGGHLVVHVQAPSRRDAYRAFLRAEQAKLDKALRDVR